MIRFDEVVQFHSPFISAASGLIVVNERFYFVADDELNLAWIPRSFDSTVRQLPLFLGSLSTDPGERKKQKPDLESLVFIPELNSILCIPSGSTPSRNRGALVTLQHEVRELSFEPLYSLLRRDVPDLNIEGAVATGSELFLFQRGNGSAGLNAVIRFELRELLSGRAPQFRVNPIDLGSVEGVRLGFTDACISRGNLWFLAAAEDASSTFSDGAFSGAILGCLDQELKLKTQVGLDLPFKPEGLVVDQNEIFVVTDADDPAVPSRLYRGLLPGNSHDFR